MGQIVVNASLIVKADSEEDGNRVVSTHLGAWFAKTGTTPPFPEGTLLYYEVGDSNDLADVGKIERIRRLREKGWSLQDAVYAVTGKQIKNDVAFESELKAD